MRKRVWITGVILVAVCSALLLWRRAPEPQIKESHEGGGVVAETNQSEVVSQVKAAAAPQNPAAPMPRSFPVAPPVFQTTGDKSNALYQQLLADWQAPIEFYGKVVDESRNAVTGASVRFSWTDMTAEDGASTWATNSDTAGLFSLQGKRGRSLTVWVSKDGYFSSGGGQQTFLYANFDAKFNPDPWSPVIFSLRKKGQAEPLVKLKRNYGIPRDGTPFAIDLVSGQAAKGENGNLVVQCWTEDQSKARGQKYDWRCRVTIPGGGIVTTSDEFAFLAPESSYQQTAEITMPADRPDWKSDVDLKFFYRLADGRYGRMTFSMIAGGQHFCMIDSFLNPSGSRNLEPAN